MSAYSQYRMLPSPGSSPSASRRDRSISTGASIRSELDRILNEADRNPLVGPTLDRFVGAYTSLRAQTLSRGAEHGDLQRSLLQAGAERLESTFRRVLESADTQTPDTSRQEGRPSTSEVSSDVTEPEAVTAAPTVAPAARLAAGSARQRQYEGAHAGSTRPAHAGRLSLYPDNDDEDDYQGSSNASAASSPMQRLESPETHQEIMEDVEVLGVTWDDDGGPVPARERLLASGEAVLRLRKLATAMVKCGLDDACARVYRDVRCQKLRGSLASLARGPSTREEAEALGVEAAEECIWQWKRQAAVALSALLPAERRLCAACLGDCSWLAKDSMRALTDQLASLLFPIPEALADALNTEYKLANLLDLYKAVEDLRPALVESCPVGVPGGTELTSRARRLDERVKRAVRDGFVCFKHFIAEQEPHEAPPDGCYPPDGQDSLVIYVMKIVSHLYAEYYATLESIFGREELEESLEALLRALESFVMKQAKLYEDEAQSAFFLMNNHYFISQSIKQVTDCRTGQSSQAPLGTFWRRGHSRAYSNYSMAFRKKAWFPVMGVIDSQHRQQGQPSSSSWGLFSEAALVRFSQAVERAYEEQRTWRIADKALRQGLRAEVKDNLTSSFRSFVAKPSWLTRGFNERLRSTTITEEATLDRLVDNLFSGPEPSKSFAEVLAGSK